MSGFKIFGIQPLENCNREVLKGLVKNELYLFFNEFTVVKDQFGKVISIVTPTIEIDLYSSNENQKISISAIVGENGSGKSSLLEILYLTSLCLSKDQLNIKNELKKIGSKNKIIGGYVLNIINTLHLELFYTTQSIEDQEKTEIRSILFENGNILHFEFTPKKDKLKNEFNPHQYAYSIALNYSLYGLNEIHTPWLSPMFHKNDGYQAPLVINPYRLKGLIDVNKENDLSNYRLIQNIVESKKNNYELINGKYVNEIEFYLDVKSLYAIYWNDQRINISNSKKVFKKENGSSIYNLINLLIKKFNTTKNENGFKRKINLIDKKRLLKLEELSEKGIDYFIDRISHGDIINNRKDEFNDYLDFFFLEYIIKKILKLYLLSSTKPTIVNTIMGESFEEFILKLGSPSERNKFIADLSKDKSHITLKIRQMLFLWDSNFFTNTNVEYSRVTRKEDYSELNRDYKLMVKLPLSDLDKYFSIINKLGATGLEMVPGGVFQPEIKYALPNSSLMHIPSLSSGELQFLFTIHTVLYHLRNINSVQNSGSNNKILYKNINLLFDEIEICFHPNFQRIFISELLRNLNEMDIENIKSINILFSTHSPFILSDIPQSNILRLESGSKSTKQFHQTFGANIHDLLANDFFLKDGFIGEFAKEKINDIIHNLSYKINEKEIELLKVEYAKTRANYKKMKIDALIAENNYLSGNFNIRINETKENFDKIIELVGELVIKDKLNEMCKLAFN